MHMIVMPFRGVEIADSLIVVKLVHLPAIFPQYRQPLSIFDTMGFI